MATLDLFKVKTELTYFLRNSDIFTIAQRGVTTTTDTGTFASDSTHLINVSNGKNIRSIVVAAVTLTYGQDYEYDVNYDDSGTIKIQITFTSAQTGAYTITYDYGTDKIYPDFPRPDLTIDSFPRIGLDVTNTQIQPAGFQNVDVSNVDATVIIYDKNTRSLSGYVSAIRSAVHTAYKSFYFVGKYTHVLNLGPVLKTPRSLGKDIVWQQNVDIRGEFNYEK